MLQYILVRHGESTANVDESEPLRIRECDIPLTINGYSQAIEIAPTVQELLQQYPCKVILSPYTRAKETFLTMFRNLKPFKLRKMWEDARLREFDYGRNHALPAEQKAQCKIDIAKCGGLFYYEHDGGESYTALITRLATLHNEMVGEWREDDYPDQTILIVAHAHVLAVFDVLLLRKSPNEVDYKLDNCEIRRYVKERGKYELVDYRE